MNSDLTLADLQKGISWWRTAKQDKWPQDFHNSVYYELYNLRRGGLTARWWESTVDRLWDWRAIRSRTAPNTKKEIHDRGLLVLDRLQSFYSGIRANAHGEPVFLDFTCPDVKPLYNELARIKGSASPNFPSKTSHFIFPRLFKVMDHQATGIEDYGASWSSMRGAWTMFRERRQAKNILQNAILAHSRGPVHKLYPFEIKIIELCSIGRKHAST